MISYFTITSAKNGDRKAVDEILNYYLPKIKNFSTDEEFVQMALISVFDGILKFENRKK